MTCALQRPLRAAAALALALAVLSPSTGIAGAAWSPSAVVTTGNAAVSDAEVWAGPGGRVAVTWASTGNGPAGTWFRTYDPNSGWQTAVRVSTNIDTTPAVFSAAFLRNGNLAIAYASDSGFPGLGVSTYSPAGDLVHLDTIPSAAHGLVWNAQMVTAPTGDVALAWRVNQTGGSALYVAWSSNAGDWSTPSRVDSENPFIIDFAAASRTDEELTVAWVEQLRGGPTGQRVWARSIMVGGGPLDDPELVANVTDFSYGSLALAANTRGDLTAAWVNSTYSGATGNQAFLQAAGRSNGTGWSAPVQIVQATWVGEPQLPARTAGEMRIVWAQAMEGGTVTCYATAEGPRNWSAPSALFDGSGASTLPVIASAPEGRAVVAWYVEDESGISLWATDFSASASQDDRARLQGNLGRQGVPASVAADTRGVEWVAWSHFESGTGEVYVRATGLPTGEDVTRVAGVSPPGLGGLVIPLGIGVVATVAALWMWRKPQ